MATDFDKYEGMTEETGLCKPVQNACKLCSPLGACLFFKGIENCVNLIHGSQGCATYIRRYLISHFREPVDIASTNFSEETAIFGGYRNFYQSIENIIRVYGPEIIGISSTCLSETIGEDISSFIKNYTKDSGNKEPLFIFASTPSYAGTHAEGFHETVLATVKTLASGDGKFNGINFLPGMLSPADIRHLKDIMADFELNNIVLPDYSETLDNPTWKTYKRIPEGGTSVEKIRIMGSAKGTIEFGTILNKGWNTSKTKNIRILSAGEFLEKEMSVKNIQIPIPVGISLTDKFFASLKLLSAKETPEKYEKERGRLIDSYIDAHKLLFGKRAIVYGEEDLVVAISAFLAEIGMIPVVVASGGESNMLKNELKKVMDVHDDMVIENGMDFEKIRQTAEFTRPDIIIGNSKGYYISRQLGIPLVRIGFPVHDRIGAQRIMHVGYYGTQQLFDRIVNALMEYKQDNSPVGYKYM